jgi:hypothetical protein
MFGTPISVLPSLRRGRLGDAVAMIPFQLTHHVQHRLGKFKFRSKEK